MGEEFGEGSLHNPGLVKFSFAVHNPHPSTTFNLSNCVLDFYTFPSLTKDRPPVRGQDRHLEVHDGHVQGGVEGEVVSVQY